MRAEHRRTVDETRTAFDAEDKAKEAAFAAIEDAMRHDPSRASLAEKLPQAIQVTRPQPVAAPRSRLRRRERRRAATGA
jgi:hypothetical protein